MQVKVAEVGVSQRIPRRERLYVALRSGTSQAGPKPRQADGRDRNRQDDDRSPEAPFADHRKATVRSISQNEAIGPMR